MRRRKLQKSGQDTGLIVFTSTAAFVIIEIGKYDHDGKQRTCYGDVYFKKNGQEYFIEYHGQQHYKAVRFGSTDTVEQAEKKFERQKFRDAEMERLCKERGAKLIIIDGRKLNNYDKIFAFLKEQDLK